MECSIIDGYEGDKADASDQKGKRVVSGWRNAGAPWTLKVDVNKIYGNSVVMKLKWTWSLEEG